MSDALGKHLRKFKKKTVRAKNKSLAFSLLLFVALIFPSPPSLYGENVYKY